jgi:ring-1,2-phenylacetyl-CoA epoxidase subunit PaaC
MSFDDDAYGALTDHADDARWAYGTGFTDPLAGVPTAAPAGVGHADLATYCLMLGDDALIMSHRLQQWVTRAPELEDELALANIALDLLGQARLLLTRAGEMEAGEAGSREAGDSSGGRDEDALAYLRDAGDFRNVRLAELADGDFAELVARLLVFSCWRLPLLDRLAASRDPVLAAIGAKGVKEVAYHREYAAQWVVRLGDGTEVSHQRMRAAIGWILPLAGELFRPHEVEIRLAAAGVAVDPALLRAEFDEAMSQVLDAATLGDAALSDAATLGDAVTSGAVTSDDAVTSADAVTGRSVAEGRGREGVHGPELTEILAEMQGLARALPGGVW